MVRVAQQEIMGSGKQGLTHWCPTIAYLPQAPFHLKRLQSRLPRYVSYTPVPQPTPEYHWSPTPEYYWSPPPPHCQCCAPTVRNERFN
ncbi:uncharacterized protein LOC135372181 isoform X4 [Ornithodoros turicata]|uniref:uncharacterized protein LOC135372181 isoform X4 n=1 Tax=Ornithodoros turicata TaxID=34597 RepID=UPI003139DC95